MLNIRRNQILLAVQKLTLVIALTAPIGAAAQTAAPTPAPVATPVPLPLPTTPVFSSKDWRLEERTSTESAEGICVASTTALYDDVNHHLEVVIDRSGARPLEIRIRPDYDTDPLTLGLKASLDRKATQVYSFAPIASADAQRQTFWNVPRGTVALISYLKREMRFDVESLLASAPVPTPLPNGKPAPAVKPLAFSLRGSSATISELQKRCNDKKELGADGFERAFLPAVVATVDPSKLSAADTARLRDLVSVANVAFRTSNLSQTAMNALTAQYLVQLKEFEQLKRNVDRLTNQEIVKLQKRRSDSQAAINTAQTELPQLRAQVGARESELATANHDYEVAYNILAPLLPQLRVLQNAIDSASSSLSQAQSQLSTAVNYQAQTEAFLRESINGIAVSERNVVVLQNELDNLRPELSRANSAVDYARRDLANAESRRRGYNRGGEIRDRLSRDYRYSQAENRERDIRNQIGSANQNKNSTEQVLRSAEQNKRQAEQTKRQAEQNKRQAEQTRERAQEELGRCQTTNTPENPVDCSSWSGQVKQAESDIGRAAQEIAQADQAVAQADQAVRQAEPAARQAADRVRDLERDLQTAQREMESVRSSVERDVDSEIEKLVREEQNMNGRLREAEAVAGRIDRRMRDLANIEIPSAQNEVTKWRASRSQAETDLRSAQADVSRAQGYVRDAESDLSTAESRMSSYKNANGYRQKKADVDRTLERVNSLKSELRRLDREIVKREALIRDETQALLVIEQEMQKIVSTIQQKEARSAEVQKMLEPYFLEHNALTQKKMAADQAFADSQSRFAQGLPQ